MQSACVMLSVACPALQYFSTYFINGTTFGEKVVERKMCLDFLYNFCMKHFSF